MIVQTMFADEFKSIRVAGNGSKCSLLRLKIDASILVTAMLHTFSQTSKSVEVVMIDTAVTFKKIASEKMVSHINEN